jgi:sulfatase maturation enzyme AslB (radical SAM superfamily)
MDNKKIFWLQPKDTQLGNWQRKIFNLSESQTFCILPWIHFATRPNGDMRLCCSANASGAGNDHTVGLVKNESGKPANFGKETPMSAWNNEYMRSVRTTMLEGNIPLSCSKCFEEESRGVSSKRMWETATWIQDGIDIPELISQTQENGTIPEKLVYLDLRLGHTCNLKCVMCSPHDSSMWVPEHKKIFPLFQHSSLKEQMQWDQKTFNNYWHENPEFWKEMYAQIPNLKQVYFAGGEPLLIKEHKAFIEEIIRQGYQDQILLRYNSNGLLVNDDIIKLWSKFKRVKFAVSLDAVSDRNHYIRFPTDWNIIEKNLRKLDSTPDNIEVSLATAIQVLNIKHLPDFARWKINSNFRKINKVKVIDDFDAGGGIFNMHLLYIPTFLSIRILPEKDKQEIREIFTDFKQWLWDNYRQDDNFWKENPYGWKRWQAILDFMDAEDHSHLISAFQEYVEKLDINRKTDFKSIFPELAHLLNK